jgi:hypothetical protein
MDRIHEEYKQDQLLIPQTLAAGGNVTGSYKAAIATHDIQVVAQASALVAGKYVKAEVFEADNNAGLNAAEVTACETTYTAPGGGATSVKIIVSLNASKLSKPYFTVKLTTDSALDIIIQAYAMQEGMYADSSLNSDASAITVV